MYKQIKFFVDTKRVARKFGELEVGDYCWVNGCENVVLKTIDCEPVGCNHKFKNTTLNCIDMFTGKAGFIKEYQPITRCLVTKR